MANDLTTTDPTNSLTTRWSPPQLPASLVTILADKGLWADRDARLPALSRSDREAAERALEIYAAAPKGSAPDQIAACVGEASAVMAKRQTTAIEAELRMDLYERELADIDQDVLKRAFAEAMRTMTFFPTIAEIREIASRLPAPPRVFIAWRMRQLLAVPPEPAAEELVDAAEVFALLGSLSPDDTTSGARVPTLGYSKSLPTVEDYLALGLSEDEAIEQWGKYFEMMRIPQPERPAEQKAA